MTKKNLSDLLKEEAGPAASATAETKAAPAKTPAKSSPARSSSRLTKADLEKQITQLEADLIAAKQQEDSLTRQVEGLKGDLAKQQDYIFELKESLEKTQTEAQADAEKLQKVTEELTAAKQTILKMTEAAETAPKAAKPPQQTAKAAAPKPALSVKMRSGGDIYKGSRRLPARKPIPDYAIEHGEQKNRMLTNDEIGWVD